MAKNFFLIFICIIISFNSKAQVDKSSELYKNILTKDSLLFNIGFNTCDIFQFEKLFSDKFEFYHDKDGVSTKEKFLNDLRKGLCANPSNFQARRELLPESTKIYALYEKGILYGAIQEGIHQFYEKQTNQPEKFGSSAKFTHVWLLENGDWKLTKSLSFEHEIKKLTSTTPPISNQDEEIVKWLKAIKVPTLGIGVIEDGKLKQIKVFGEIKQGISAPYNTIFNVASLTKPVTAMVALKLISMDKWSLDDPIYRFWIDPDIKNDSRNKKLTTRLILSHQTGFPNWRWLNEDHKLSFQFDPGTKYQYSGEGFEYLRKALEAKFSKTLNQLAEELIFNPLKMYDSKYFWDEKTDSLRYAIGYDKNLTSYETEKNETSNGADNLLTTIEDYGNFLVGVMKGEGLTEQIFKEMTSNQVESTKGKHFGLGFEIYDLDNGDYALSHGGSDKGCQTIAFILPKTQQGLIIFTNVDDGYKVYERLIHQYLKAPGDKIIAIETK